MIEPDRDEYILLSGIQHYAFCPRQWALIHIEGMWSENYLTAQGRLLHDKADDPWFNELRKGKIISRAMPIRSEKLLIQGVADIVELMECAEGVTVPGRPGKWSLYPVEYKRGKPKSEDCDRLQLCAQAICLEEMLDADIPSGEIFYGQIRRRVNVDFDEELRSDVVRITQEMHRVFETNELPHGKKEKHCGACSLVDDCQPGLGTMAHRVEAYIEKALAVDEVVGA